MWQMMVGRMTQAVLSILCRGGIHRFSAPHRPYPRLTGPTTKWLGGVPIPTSVPAVPEPLAGAMMLIGFSGLCVLASRRSRHTANAGV